ncbi:MAG: DNA-formamidopyrimidine glycosylase, partial [Cyanobacteriota bacterium]
MPELPEVEIVCRGLNAFASGQFVEGVTVLRPQTFAYPPPSAPLNLEGRQFGAWRRRGKYLLGELLENGVSAGYLGVHLRMTGQLLWVPSNEPRATHTKVCFHCRGGRDLRFIDIRTFGKLWRLPAGVEPETIISGLKTLGPEPWAESFTPQFLEKRFSKSRRPLKTALLDQRLVAGLGNIYADEVLFQTGLHPLTPANVLTPAQTETLHRQIQQTLEQAISAGGTTFSNFRGVTGINGNYGGQAWVYGRRGEPCRVCGVTIERLKIGGRSSHFCPQCQPEKGQT